MSSEIIPVPPLPQVPERYDPQHMRNFQRQVTDFMHGASRPGVGLDGRIIPLEARAKVEAGVVYALHPDFSATTSEAQIQNAIDYAETNGYDFVLVSEGLISSGYDASLVDFTGSGGTWAGRMMRAGQRADVSDAKAYGAAGDGVTDDTAAISAAVSVAAQNGRTVFIPEGSYRVSRIVIPAGVEIVGTGPGSSLVSSSDMDTLLVTGDAVRIADLEIVGFGPSGAANNPVNVESGTDVVLSGLTVTEGSTNCIRIGPTSDQTKVVNCIIRNWHGAVFSGVVVFADHCLVQGCNVLDGAFVGITVSGKHNRILHNFVTGGSHSGINVFGPGADGNVVAGNEVAELPVGSGIVVDGGSAGKNTDNQVTDNWIHAVPFDGVRVKDSDRTLVEGNRIDGNVSQHGVSVESSSDCLVLGNHITNSGVRGISASSGAEPRTSIVGNLVVAAGDRGIYVFSNPDCHIEGNQVSLSGSHGILVQNCARASVQSNHVVDNGQTVLSDGINMSGSVGALVDGNVSANSAPGGSQRYGINAPSGSGMVIGGNLLLNNALGALNGGATATVYTGAPGNPGAVYAPTNVTTDRSYDANATTISEIADVLGTLIADLQAAQIIT